VRTSLEVRATSLGCKLFIDNATRNDEKRASRIAQFYMRIRHGYIRHVASWYHLYCIRHTGKMEFNIDSSNLYSLCRLSRNLFQILTSFQSKLSQCTNKVKDESRDNSRHFVQVYFSILLGTCITYELLYKPCDLFSLSLSLSLSLKTRIDGNQMRLIIESL